MRISGYAFRSASTSSLALAAVALSGCAAVALPQASQESLLLAGHQDLQHRYLEAAPDRRREMLENTGPAIENGDTRARLRQALLLSAPGADTDSLAEAIRMFDALSGSDSLTPGEQRAIGVWRANAEVRLELQLENSQLSTELGQVKHSLEQARRQIEQLTRIEEELEAENGEDGEP